MKKLSLLALALLLASCGGTPTSNNSMPGTPSLPPSVGPSLPDSSNPDSTTTPLPTEYKTIAEINTLGASLGEGTTGDTVRFKGTYIKKITDNLEKVMLFADGDSYIYVRVESGKWSTFLENRYIDYSYDVAGTLSKKNGNIELNYIILSNIDNTINVDYTKIAETKESIFEVYKDFEKLTLTNKYNGIGKIVTVEGQLIATDRSNANMKGVISDRSHVLTVIDSTKIASANEVGKTFRITGSLSVLKSAPALLVLKNEIIDNTIVDFAPIAIGTVSPDYFSRWTTLSDHMNPPSVNDYALIYETTGYVKSDDQNGKAYLGIVNAFNGSLDDTGKTSINGFFLMNNLNMDANDLSYSVFTPYFNEEIAVTFRFTMFQFETAWHGWKMMPIDASVPVIAE